MEVGPTPEEVMAYILNGLSSMVRGSKATKTTMLVAGMAELLDCALRVIAYPHKSIICR